MFKKIYNLPYIDVVIIESYNNLKELVFIGSVNGLMTTENIKSLIKMQEFNINNLLNSYKEIKQNSTVLLKHHEIIELTINKIK